MTGQQDDFRHLDRAGRAAASVGRSPRSTVVLVLGCAFLLAWTILGAMAIRGAATGSEAGTGGPGDRLLQHLPQFPLPAFLERFFVLCLSPVSANGDLGQVAALVLMWFLMAIATMLPSAAPMIRTYCEIADTARLKREPVAHPLVLVAGYLATWLAASVLFAAVTVIVHRLAATSGMLEPVTGAAGAIALLVAGLYQFSALKQACLDKCRNPFSILFANWSARPARIFRLGLDQGLWCLGCCWALMLVMFAVGVMNVFWMALIGLFTLIEKQWDAGLPTRLAGAILLVWAAALILVLA